MKLGRALTTLAATFMLLGAAGSASADELYWNETNFAAPHGRIDDSNGGGDALFALDPGTLPEGIAFDEVHHKIYWVEAAYSGARILRADPNYTNVEVLVSGGSSYRGLALDVAGNKMYWTSSNQIEGGKIRRANLDGTNVQVVVDLGPGPSNPRGIALDLSGGKMYWADLGLNLIRRANLDGSLPEDFVSVAMPWGVAVDPVGGYLYETNYQLGNISRAALFPGSPLTKWKAALSNPTYLTLDLAGGRMFWIEIGGPAPRLRRSSLAQLGTIDDLPVAVSSYGGLSYSPNSIVGASGPTPVTRLELEPTSPNPVSSSAQVAFALPRGGHVTLRVMDVRGREVVRLVDGDRPAGRQSVPWTGKDGRGASLDAGIYFLRLETASGSLVRRIVLLNAH